MTLHIQTARISYGGAGRLDVTRQGESPFAPSWELLAGTKRYLKALAWTRRQQEPEGWKDAWDAYRGHYTTEMRRGYRDHRAAWDELLARDHVVLVCFCVDSRRCHRTLLAEILVKLGAVYDGEIEP